MAIDSVGLAEALKAFADVTRLQMLRLLLTRGELCVCEVMAHVHLTQSHVSFHLKTLKHAGLVTARKEGKWQYYTLNRPVLAQCLAALGDLFDCSQWPEIPEASVCPDTDFRQQHCR